MRVCIVEKGINVTYNVVICSVNVREETGCAPSAT